MNTKWMRISFAFLLFAMVFIWLSGGSTATSSSAHTPLVKIQYSGGMCPEGPCFGEEVIYADGSVSDGENLSSEELDALKQEIHRWDPQQLIPDPNAFCSSWVDGQDISFVFPTSASPEEAYTTCQYSNSQEVRLFILISELLYSEE